ncbi:MAG: HAD-IC family P-type ATPase, partial [Spirochaetales bacterium]
ADVDRLMRETAEYANAGKTSVLFQKGGKLLGLIALADSVREDSVDAIRQFREMGIRTVMLTGDRKKTADAIAAEVGVDEVVAEVLPDGKEEVVRRLMGQGRTAMIGDGINDAPVLIAADCSIAMGKAGSASAIEAAGTVIMNDNLESIPLAMKISKKTVKIAAQNIAFALGIKILCMVLGAFGIAGMGLAVFADTGVALLCVLNSLRALRIKA